MRVAVARRAQGAAKRRVGQMRLFSSMVAGGTETKVLAGALYRGKNDVHGEARNRGPGAVGPKGKYKRCLLTGCGHWERPLFCGVLGDKVTLRA